MAQPLTIAPNKINAQTGRKRCFLGDRFWLGWVRKRALFEEYKKGMSFLFIYLTKWALPD